MDDIFNKLQETITKPDCDNEDTINLSEICLRVGSSSGVFRMDPPLCDNTAQAELIPYGTVVNQEILSDVFMIQETLPCDTNNDNYNMESESFRTEFEFGGIVSSQESSSTILNTPETTTNITNRNNEQKIKFEEKKTKLHRPKKLILPMSRMVITEEVYPSTPEVIEKALDLEEERSPTRYSSSSNSSTVDLFLQNLLSNCPSEEDLSSNSTASSTLCSYPSTSTKPIPTFKKRRGRPRKTDDSLPKPEELEHLSEVERTYYEMRAKNNISSRRSRQTKKYKDEKSEQELEELQCQNTALTSKCSSLEAIREQLNSMVKKLKVPDGTISHS